MLRNLLISYKACWKFCQLPTPETIYNTAICFLWPAGDGKGVSLEDGAVYNVTYS